MKTAAPLRRIGSAFLDLFFPIRCLGCGSEGRFLCSRCRGSLHRIEAPFCQRCGTPLNDRVKCPTCSSHPLTSIDAIRSLFLLEGTMRQVVLQFKYRHLRAAAPELGELMAATVSMCQQPGEILIAVPLHPKRLRQRGYNQSSLLAAELGRRTGLAVLEGALARVRDTIPQARTKSAAERRSNVQGAFACRQDMVGRDILLIDDVCTTGATLDACASALKAAGAVSVRGLTLATEIFPAPAAKP